MLILLTAALLLVPGVSQAQVDWTGLDSDWHTMTNWSTGVVPLVDEIVNVNNAGTANIAADVPATGTGRLTELKIGYGAGLTGTVIQTGGTVMAKSIYLGQDTGIGNYTLAGGTLDVSDNSSGKGLVISKGGGVVSTFTQTGGVALIRRLHVGSDFGTNNEIGVYNMVDGELTVTSSFNIANRGSSSTHTNSNGTFNQSGGTVKGTQIRFGSEAGGVGGGAVYNLDGGSLTLSNASPFPYMSESVQGVNPNIYFDFDGGAMNLIGTWDFARLTGIPGEDFRVAGTAATAPYLAFTPIDIGGTAYTQITGNIASGTMTWDGHNADWGDLTVHSPNSHWDDNLTPDLPTDQIIAVIPSGTVTVPAGYTTATAMGAEINGTATVTVADTGKLTVPVEVLVTAGANLNVNGTLDAGYVNTAGTTAFGASALGTVGQLNVTDGTTTLGADTVNNVDVRGTGSVVLNTNIEVDHLSLTGGGITFNPNGNNVTFATGGRLTIGAGATYTAPGDTLTIAGNSTLSLTNDAQLSLAGAGAHKITVATLQGAVTAQGEPPVVLGEPLDLKGQVGYTPVGSGLSVPADWAVSLDTTANRASHQSRFMLTDLSGASTIDIAGKLLVSGVVRLPANLDGVTVSDTGVAGGEHGVVFMGANYWQSYTVGIIETSGDVEVGRQVMGRGVKGDPGGNPANVDLVTIWQNDRSGGWAAHGDNPGDPLNLSLVFPGTFTWDSRTNGFADANGEAVQWGSPTATGPTIITIYDRASSTAGTDDLPEAVVNVRSRRTFLHIFGNSDSDADYVQVTNSWMSTGTGATMEIYGDGNLVLTGHTGEAGSGNPSPYLGKVDIEQMRDKSGISPMLTVDGTFLVNDGKWIMTDRKWAACRLGGIGTIGGADNTSGFVRIIDRSTLAPGSVLEPNTAGTLTVRGLLEMEINARYEFEFAASGNDLIVVEDNGGASSGDIHFKGNWELILSDIDGGVANATDKVKLMSYEGVLINDLGGGTITFDVTGLGENGDVWTYGHMEGVDLVLDLIVAFGDIDGSNYVYLTGLSGGTPVGPELPGDANDNGFVDDDDLAILLSNWEQDPGTITTWALGDFTADTDVDDDDLAVLLGNWTGPGPAGAAVPEPATMALLALGGLSVLRRRRKL